MTAALARRRAMKAQRRKIQTEAKRREQRVDASLPGLVRSAATGTVHTCLVQQDLFERGLGTVVLVRATARDALVMASFLLDVHCRGIKNAMLAPVSPDELAFYIATLDSTAEFEAVDPAYACKLVRAAAAYGRSVGFEPHRDHALAERLFGDLNPEACPTRFEFGVDGKPCYVPGPGETAGQIGRHVQTMSRRLGSDGFTVMLPNDCDDGIDVAALP